jgi:small subunit ribosomal protein S7
MDNWFCKKKKRKTMADRLAEKFSMIAILVSIKKKEDLHKMAEANKAFAHYRW